ncbi:MAG: hypothetical protein KKA90_02025 [Nanoarchaeota archaeon]|nr:hypothetical protein [Nanoarchaeota archaeon]
MKLRTKPTARPSQRYLFFKVHAEEPVAFENLQGRIFEALEDYLGVSGVSQANLKLIKNLWDRRAKTGVLRCTPKTVDEVKLALALIHQLGDQPVLIQTRRVSGTIAGGKRSRLRNHTA